MGIMAGPPPPHCRPPWPEGQGDSEKKRRRQRSLDESLATLNEAFGTGTGGFGAGLANTQSQKSELCTWTEARQMLEEHDLLAALAQGKLHLYRTGTSVKSSLIDFYFGRKEVLAVKEEIENRHGPAEHHDKKLPTSKVFWALPTGKDVQWLVPEADDTLEWARGLEKENPIVVAGKDATTSGDRSLGAIRDKMFSSLKWVGKFALAGMVWVGFGFVIDRRIPEGIGFIFTLLGLAAVGYAVARHGYAALRWKQMHDNAQNIFCRIRDWQWSALIRELDAAIQYRASLAMSQMGNTPERELLDAKDYEKLSAEKGIPMDDIVRLSKTLKREFGNRSVTEIAKDFNLSIHAAGVYRDLAGASMALETNAVVKET